MTEYQFPGPTRVCGATGRELKPGDRFVAVLSAGGGEFVRTDYAADSWAGPPPGHVAYWAGTVPPADKPRSPAVDDDLLVACFERLEADPDGRNVRYVAALLLLRRKRFRFEDAVRDDAGNDVLLVRDARGGVVHRVPDPRLADDRVAAVQAELFRLLGWD